jgi:hypothetical protein
MQASALMQLFLRPNPSAVLRSSLPETAAAEDTMSSARQDMWMGQGFNDDDDDAFGGNDESTCELLPVLACCKEGFANMYGTCFCILCLGLQSY